MPLTLAQIGMKEGTDLEAKLRNVVKVSRAKGETIHNLPFKVTEDQVYAAIVTADRLGRAWLAQ